MFHIGEHLALAAVLPTALFLFVGWRLSSKPLPTRADLRGRVLAIRLFRWVGLGIVVVGLVLMGLASI